MLFLHVYFQFKIQLVKAYVGKARGGGLFSHMGLMAYSAWIVVTKAVMTLEIE